MKRLIPLLLTGVFISCERELPIEAPPFKSEIVVNSIIRPDTIVSVVLSNSVGVLSIDQPEFLENATVRLYEEDSFIGIMQDTVIYAEEGGFLYFPNQNKKDHAGGIYYIDYIPEENKSYRLEIDHPDYPSSTVVTHIPQKTSNFSIELSEPRVLWYTESPSRETIPGGVEYTATIKLKDAPESNYYEIAVIKESVGFEASSDSEDGYLAFLFMNEGEFSSEDILFDEVAKPEIIDGRNEFAGDDGKVFSDLLFNNQEYSVDITFFVGVGPAHTTILEGEELEINLYFEKFSIEVRTLSEDYYRYKHTIEIQESNIDDPFAEPVQVYSNVENGTGIFAGYNVESFEFSLEEFIPDGE